MTADIHNKQKYLESYSVLNGAAVTLVVTRTREPFRAMTALREYAMVKDHAFRLWTMLQGWHTYLADQPNTPPTTDKMLDVFAALKAVNDVDGTSNGFPSKGIYVMMWPHFALPRIPPMLQCLVEYARDFTEVNKRMVLIVPPEFDLPKELEDCATLLDFDAPSQAELGEIISPLIMNLSENRRIPLDAHDMERLTVAGAGMTEQEFENALSRAIMVHRDRLPNVPVDDLCAVVSEVKTEVVKRSEVLELMPLNNMDEVGGLQLLKDWIHRRRACFTSEAREFGVDLPKGICLVGPPGTGKSLIAKATAHALGLSLIRFDVGRVFNSLVGSSEARVRGALKLAEAMAPCVVMLDELDKAFDMNSGGGDSGVGKRVMGAILTFMQESQKAIFWVMTANRTNGLPPEMLRKGRLDEVFSVTVPTEAERLEILKIHLAKRKQDWSTIVDLDVAVTASSGFVAAELEAGVKEAVVDAFHDGGAVTGESIARQFGYMKPLSVAFAEDFQAMQTWAINNARPASVDADRATPTRSRTRTRATGAPTGRAIAFDS